MNRRQLLLALAGAALAGGGHAAPLRQMLAQAAAGRRGRDVIFVPTPDEVVDKMLDMAGVTSSDVVYDLGCGDGRIVITAAQRYGARGVGVDIDPQRIAEANANARSAGVVDKVRFIEADLFETSVKEATVVTLYLLPRLNVKLRPRLQAELGPGARVVSHAFDMGDWAPEQVGHAAGSVVYLWRIAPRA